MSVVASSSSNKKTVTDRACLLWYHLLTHVWPYISSGTFVDRSFVHIFAFISWFRSCFGCWYYCVRERVQQGHTAAHSLFLPKSTPAGDRIIQDLLGCWMGAAALLRVQLHSEHLLINNTCVDLPVCPTCSLPSCTKKGQREISFVLPSWHASTAGLKGRPEPFEGEI